VLKDLIMEFQSLGLLANSYYKTTGTAETACCLPVGNAFPNWKMKEGGRGKVEGWVEG
jgi:hypothetical protein